MAAETGSKQEADPSGAEPSWTGEDGDERAYRIDEPGRFKTGGHGVVWEAEVSSARHGSEMVGKRVALKQLSVINDYRWKKLRERSPALEQLEHENLSRHLGVFTGPAPWREDQGPDLEEPHRYVVHGWVDGQPLADTIKGASPHTVLDWLRQAGRGIDYLHDQGFVHRDIHPRNFIVSAPTGQVKAIDYETIVAGESRATTREPSGSPFTPPHDAGLPPEVVDRMTFANVGLHLLAGDGDYALQDGEPVRTEAARLLKAHKIPPEPVLEKLDEMIAGRVPGSCAEIISQLQAPMDARVFTRSAWLLKLHAHRRSLFSTVVVVAVIAFAAGLTSLATRPKDHSGRHPVPATGTATGEPASGAPPSDPSVPGTRPEGQQPGGPGAGTQTDPNPADPSATEQTPPTPPVEQPVQTPTPGNEVFSDDFSSNRGWHLDEEFSYQERTLAATLGGAGGGIAIAPTDTLPAKIRVSTQVEKTSSAQGGSLGVVCRQAPNAADRYGARVFADNHFIITKLVRGWRDQRQLVYGSVSVPSGVNTVDLECSEDTDSSVRLRLLLNDNIVGEVVDKRGGDDGDPIGPGQAGVEIASGADAITGRFHSFRAIALP